MGVSGMLGMIGSRRAQTPAKIIEHQLTLGSQTSEEAVAPTIGRLQPRASQQATLGRPGMMATAKEVDGQVVVVEEAVVADETMLQEQEVEDVVVATEEAVEEVWAADGSLDGKGRACLWAQLLTIVSAPA